MTKRSLLSIPFAIVSLLIVAQFWVSYFAFCRFNKIFPFNGFVHRHPLAGGGLIVLMMIAILAGGVAGVFRKRWIPLLSLGC
jgi:hypothetical protein